MIIGVLLLAESERGKSQGSSNKRKAVGVGVGVDFHVQLMVVMSVYLNYVSHSDVDDLRGKAC